MKIIIFDLDGTLAESKSTILPEMALVLKKLLNKFKVAIISGGAWPQFEKQVISKLSLSKKQKLNLFLLPTSGTSFYQYQETDWQKLYSEDLSPAEISKIESEFEDLVLKLKLSNYSWGPRLENRGSQITFSALGQLAPIDQKREWDPTFSKRLEMLDILKEKLPEFELRTGGATSIDVTKKGIDKSYGIKKIQELLNIEIEEMLFIGDALFPGGNDHAVTKTRVKCLSVMDPSDTLKIIKKLLENKLP